MKRDEQIVKISDADKLWDLVVIGGGATGLGCAVDAAARGLSVALFEKDDFAKCTSSRSTKLVHGGVRYLQKGDVFLVIEALRERGRMKANAPHLVKDQSFVISNYRYWDNFLYFCGLSLYDLLSLGFGYGRSRFISKKKVMEYIPTTVEKGLKGGIVYHDGQFDDSRMAVNLAQTAVDKGGCVLNYATVVDIFHNENGKVAGVKVIDRETDRQYLVKARAVINAAGIFADDILKMDKPSASRMIRPSQGAHLVIDMKFLKSDYAIMVPKTSDGRVLFAVPWHNKVVVGTTDILRETSESEPKPLDKEIDFILETASLYMNPAPTHSDVLSVFAGQRPLAAPKKDGKKTKEISRSHKIIVSASKLITITGGKWTSYRLMAEDAIDKAASLKLIEKRKCCTKKLHIHGYRENPDMHNHRYVYGSDEAEIRKLMEQNPEYGKKLSEKYEYTVAEVIWAVQNEMARTIDDVLARRVRLQYIDAREAVKVAPQVAQIMAVEMKKDKAWIDSQLQDYNEILKNFIISKNVNT
ncbi:MAG: glycerol-3-phosphate dehydrogenase/oxidase [Prevotellaceae bacterium]|jgi:glycerol-3-phosphate dehydrogenase|nr:glycerol-3-phosphate dehydrogenase/oxidase [Prevotellaceae bacterium]